MNSYKYLNKLINLYSKKNFSNSFEYPLLEDAFSNEDIIKGIEVILKKKNYHGRYHKEI